MNALELEIKMYTGLPTESRPSAAENLHNAIIADAQTVATALCQLAKHLKIMRDCKLYQDIGYSDFGDYVESKIGMKSRQAYNYIAAYERLGEKYLQENADLGITKLSLLAEVSGIDRAEIEAENDLAGMTVKEVRELIKRTKDQGEQLDMMTGQTDQLRRQLTAAENRADGLQKLVDSRQKKIIEQAEKIDELENRPIEVSVREPLPQEIAALAAEEIERVESTCREEVKAVKNELDKLSEEQAAAVEAARKAGADEARQAAEAEKADILAQLEQAKSAAKRTFADDPTIREANIYFKQWRTAFEDMVARIRKIGAYNPEAAESLRNAMKDIASGMVKTLEEKPND